MFASFANLVLSNMNHKKILKYSVLAGAIYFTCIAFVHLLGIKIPMLYIYYNVPSTRYQDQIISFLAFGWSMFFYAVANKLDMIRYLLIAGLVAVLALININLSNDFMQIANTSSKVFWIQTFILAVYTLWLLYFTAKSHQ